MVSGSTGIEVADSITSDAHKLLNVPYDCGVFFTRHRSVLTSVFQNPNAAYLSSSSIDQESISSPLNIGIENSRRFRALPVYATLVAQGRSGYVELLKRQVLFARAVAKFLQEHDRYEMLPLENGGRLKNISMIVLFRAKDESINADLVTRINRTSQMYVSGTVWDDQPATRMAVSSWKVDLDKDLEVVKSVLERVLGEK